jgi:hypothetical protein
LRIHRSLPIIHDNRAITAYRLAPNTPIVNRNDQTFASLTSIGTNGHDPTHSGFNPTPPTMPYGVAELKLYAPVTYRRLDNGATGIIGINIGLTRPEAYLQFDPVSKYVQILGRDALSDPEAPISVTRTTRGDADNRGDDDRGDSRGDGKSKGERVEKETQQIVVGSGADRHSVD